MFPANGAAREELAFNRFAGAVVNPEETARAAQEASDLARSTIRAEPLASRAYVVLALAQQDQAQHRSIVDAATQINRRNLSLQGLALQLHLADNDYPKTINTLDQILRVHPKYSAEFFPVLAQALEQDATIPVFAGMLDGSSPWHQGFLRFAVGQVGALPNLAVLRQRIAIEDEDFDRRLIAGLARQDEIEAAEAVVRHVTGNTDSLASRGVIDWQADFPPFQWQLPDQPGFRAQVSRDGSKLELAVRPGKGGMAAARLMRAPVGPFEIKVAHRVAPAEQARDVRLQLICTNSATPFFDERFTRGETSFKIATLPANCDHFVLGIIARAWSGRSALGGTIDRIEIKPL